MALKSFRLSTILAGKRPCQNPDPDHFLGVKTTWIAPGVASLECVIPRTSEVTQCMNEPVERGLILTGHSALTTF